MPEFLSIRFAFRLSVELQRNGKADEIPKNGIEMENKVVNKAHSERYGDGKSEHKLIERRALDEAFEGGYTVVKISNKTENAASGEKLDKGIVRESRNK